MELLLLCGVVVLSILTISFFHFLSTPQSTKTQKHDDQSRPKLPPGSTGLPLIGETLDFYYKMWKGQTETFFYTRMAKYSSSAFKTSMLGDTTVVMCGSAGNKFLFSNGNKLVKSWKPKSVQRLFLEHGLIDTRNLKVAIGAFVKIDNIRKLVPVMDRVARGCLESQWHGQVEVYPLVKIYTFTLACYTMLSLKEAEAIKRLMHPLEAIMWGIFSLPIDFPGSGFNRALKGAKFQQMQILNIIKQRKTNPSDSNRQEYKDLVSCFIETDMPDIDIASRLVGIIFSADESHVAITSTFMVLTDYPDVYDRVYLENMEMAGRRAPGKPLSMEDFSKLSYTWNVVCEVMRMYPPGPGVFREAIADIKYCGFHIPKGFKLFASTDAVHKDPKYFTNPEKFDPSRFEGDGPLPFTYIPFGGGVGICPGRKFAQLSILAFIHNAIIRFRWERLFSDEKIVVNPFPKPTKGLPVLLHPHVH